jgi:enediyne core biosynthesis thioesterase
MKAYEHQHTVTFEETNLVGNVYYVEFLRWQGRCRELFVHEHAASVAAAVASRDLALVTLHCSCDYISEVNAFDVVTVQMRLLETYQNRIDLDFETWRQVTSGQANDRPEDRSLVARGKQTIACMERQADGSLTPVTIPEALLAALAPYRA